MIERSYSNGVKISTHAACTWGDGDDITLVQRVEGHPQMPNRVEFISVSIPDAKLLLAELQQAIATAEELEKGWVEHMQKDALDKTQPV